MVAQLFDDWAARYARGERPDPREYLERAGERQGELAGLIERYLVSAPRSAPDPETVELAEAWARGESPLVALRVRRGLTRDAVLDELSERFKLDPAARPALRERYHELEAGLIEPRALSRRLTAALADLLRTSEDAVRTWRPRRLEVSPAFRASAASQPMKPSSPGIAPNPDVDDLFLSGE